MKFITILFTLIIFIPVSVGLLLSYGEWSGSSDKRYRCKGSTNQNNKLANQAAIQIYTARSARWRGAVSSHSWIALKTENEQIFTRYEIIGWKRNKNGHYLHITQATEDNYWYGYKPVKIFELFGEKAEKLIPILKTEIKNYPFLNTYQAWPGPNSNTFIAYLAKKHSALNVDLPATAIGKDYTPGLYIGSPPSNTGKQLNYQGLIGIIIAKNEGIEFNVLSANFGIDFTPLDIKLPAIGSLKQLNSQPILPDSDCQ